MNQLKLCMVFFAAALSSLFGMSAWAQSGPDDARCFLVSSAFASSAKDERAKAVAGKAYLFYMGRLLGSAAQIESRLAAQARTITPQSAGPVMQACAQAAEQKRLQLAQIGQHLRASQAKGK